MVGVVLCRCNDKAAGVLDLPRIEHFLGEQMPGLPVMVTDELCRKPEALLQMVREKGVQRLVVGACADPEYSSRISRRAKRAGIEPFALSMVDLKGESAANYEPSELSARVGLLLWAQVQRSNALQEVPRGALRLRLERPRGKFSRRELLSLLMPRDEVMPYVEAIWCRSEEGCRLCVEACPRHAIRVEGKRVDIDGMGCRGCGACVEACPCQAIAYPTFSREQLDGELAGLLSERGVGLEPRAIAFTCQGCSGIGSRDGEAQRVYPPSMLPLRVPCLAMVSPWLMLRAFERGAQGIVLISGKGVCQAGYDSSRWQGNLRFVEGLLGCWGIPSGRLRAFEVAEGDLEALMLGLREFTEKVARMSPLILGVSSPALFPEQGGYLPSLVAGIGKKLGCSSAARVSAGFVPVGIVELDGSQCTGCGLCALACATGALAITQDDEGAGYRLLFRHDACVACGRCVEGCPEKCLRLQHVLDLGRIDAAPEVLFVDSMVECRQCGVPIAPRAMLNRLRARVSGDEDVLSSDLCSACAIVAQVSLVRLGKEG